MLNINSIQAFKGTILCPGKTDLSKKGNRMDFKFQTENVSAIINDFNHDDTRIVFKDNTPDLYVKSHDVPTKDIVSAYAAAKDSDIIISL